MKTVAFVISQVGFHWEEVTAAFIEFQKAGWKIELYTLDGGAPKADPASLKKTGPLALMGLGVSSCIAPGSELGNQVTEALKGVRPVSELEPGRLDALYLPGGHGCLFDLNVNPTLHAKIGELHASGKLLSGVCHATSTYAFVKSGGRAITEGKRMTGFPEPMDRALVAGRLVPKQFLPIPFSNDGKLKEGGARLGVVNQLIALMNPTYTRVDPPFFTGTGPKAAKQTARNVIRHLS
jgi:putative intracellular protease/amidase